MSNVKERLKFLSGRPARFMSLLLALQAAAVYSLSSRPEPPAGIPLAEMPHQVAEWTLLDDGRLDPEVMALLEPDDYLSRTYTDGRAQAHLLVVYFKSHKSGFGPHSPQICLPGTGWSPDDQRHLDVDVPDGRLPVNYLVAKRGSQRAVVVYWYQTTRGAIASEIMARLYLIAESVRFRRTDTALVRVVVPVTEGGTEKATQTALRFVRDVALPLKRYIPPA